MACRRLWVFLPLGTGAVLYLLDGLAGARSKALLVLVVDAGRRDLADHAICRASIICLRSFCTRVGSCFRSPAFIAATYGAASTRCSRSCCCRCRRCRGPRPAWNSLFIWELITLSSYFLVVRRREAAAHALRYLLFSLVAAFFLLAGFAMAYAVNGSISLSALRMAGPDSNVGFAAAGDRLSDQGGRDRRPCLAAGRLCGSRRRRVRDAVRRHQQGADLRAAWSAHISRYVPR